MVLIHRIGLFCLCILSRRSLTIEIHQMPRISWADNIFSVDLLSSSAPLAVMFLFRSLPFLTLIIARTSNLATSPCFFQLTVHVAPFFLSHIQQCSVFSALGTTEWFYYGSRARSSIARGSEAAFLSGIHHGICRFWDDSVGLRNLRSISLSWKVLR